LPAQWTHELFGARASFGARGPLCEAGPGETRVGRERERNRELASRTHGSATTTPSVREAIQASEEKNTVLARRHGVNRKTIAKWKARPFSSDMRMGPKNPRSKSLTLEDEMLILAYRWRTRLSLDDSLVRLRRLMPQLSRSALYRCLERYGLSKIGRTNVSPPLTNAGLVGPTVLKSPLTRWPATSSAFRSSSPSRRSPNTFMGRWLNLRLKTRPRFLPGWSLNFRKRSTPSPRISVRPSHM
jgi:hypothetical protein